MLIDFHLFSHKNHNKDNTKTIFEEWIGLDEINEFIEFDLCSVCLGIYEDKEGREEE